MEIYNKSHQALTGWEIGVTEYLTLSIQHIPVNYCYKNIEKDAGGTVLISGFYL